MKRLLWVLLCLLWSVCGYAQQKELFFEKVYLHTDRQTYVQGDTLWFKAYLTNAQTGRLSGVSNNLHVELIAPDNKIITSQITRMDNGLGNGDILFSDSLPAGSYRIRAYTNWMRNFGSNFFFEQPVAVLALPGSKTIAAIAASATGNPGAAGETGHAATLPGTTINFFPEGGSLVEGLTGLVAVKAENAVGRGMPVTGFVLSSKGDTVSRFVCDSAGLGLFSLLPINGLRYSAKAGSQVYPLPAALLRGPVLHVRQTDSLVSVLIAAAQPAADTSYLLTVKHAGIRLVSETLHPKNAQAVINIPASLLPEGINVITLYNQQSKPCCERLVYVHHTHTAGLHIAVNQVSGKALSVQMSSLPNTRLSMAALDAALVGHPQDMATYLTLTSELKGHIEYPERYLDTANVNRFKQTDLLLLTQGWRDFVWHRMADTAIRISYAPENGFEVRGRLTKRNGKEPLPGTSVSLYAPGLKGDRLFSAITNSTGQFDFLRLMATGKDGATITARDLKGKDAGLITVDTSRYVSPRIDAVQKGTPAGIAASASAITEKIAAERKIRAPVQLGEVKVRGSNYIQLRDTRLTTFGYPDEVLVPEKDDKPGDDIRTFILQHSKLAHLENEAQVNSGKLGFGGNSNAVVLNRLVFYADGHSTSPRLIVNGYEQGTSIFGSEDEQARNDLYNTYFDLPLSKAEKVVIRRGLAPSAIAKDNNRTGRINMGGGAIGSTSITTANEFVFVVYITLKPGAMDSEHSNIAQVTLQGYDEPRIFYKPKNQKEADQSGYRPTLHWEPNITTDASGKAIVTFYNNQPGKVYIVVQGITEQGQPVASTTYVNSKADLKK